jgi:hypothetical protein
MIKLIRTLAVLSVMVSGAAFAEQPGSSGLGQSWPNAPDVSRSVHYHVFVFVKDGIRYIQVNDTAGRVRGAVATAGNQVLVLPIGTGAQVVAQSAPPADTPASAPAAGEEPVYQDDQMTVTAQPQQNGTLLLKAVAGCQDPIECNSKFNTASPN